MMIETEGLPKVLPGVDSISEGTNKPLDPRSHRLPQVLVLVFIVPSVSYQYVI